MSMSVDRSQIPDIDGIRRAESLIRDRVPESPLLRAYDLGDDLEQDLWLKAESLQPTGSFKIRGATHWMRTASREELERGLVTVSAGNHALALAWAAAGQAPVTVVMPEGASPMKVEGTRNLGAKVVLHGRIQEAVAECHRLSREDNLVLVHPYNDPRIMAGQATIGLEIMRQLPEVARVLCPIGGGGLISGLGLALKALKPDIELIGVEPEGAATMRNAWDLNDDSAALDGVDTVAHSLAPVVVGNYSYAVSRDVVDDIVTVSDRAIIDGTRRLLSRGHLYVEAGAAVTVAALLEKRVAASRDRPTVAIMTGGNMDLDQLCSFATD